MKGKMWQETEKGSKKHPAFFNTTTRSSMYINNHLWFNWEDLLTTSYFTLFIILKEYNIFKSWHFKWPVVILCSNSKGESKVLEEQKWKKKARLEKSFRHPTKMTIKEIKDTSFSNTTCSIHVRVRFFIQENPLWHQHG